ncbi:STAS domain-containing protein [Streptomyces sp. NPDC002057]|uniref:STAS domain-containing protein n=1 Tax=Streptomyces sp. NPDC002057 TaxID=3154664 RepID=UPI0033172F2A
MTTHPHYLRLTTVGIQDSVRIEVHGDLDYDSADLLLEEATAQLAARPALTDLHLHCAGLGAVDSMGLSALLMIGRRTTVAGVRLHLDDRPANLDRLLELTGTLDYLTTPLPTGAAETSVTEEMAARPTGPDGPT